MDLLRTTITKKLMGTVPVHGVDANTVASMTTDLEFKPTRVSYEDLLRCCCCCCCCWAARSCWPIAALDSPRALQDRMPSYHVCSACALTAPPQVPNQEPPRPQQLLLPDLRTATHLPQTELAVFVVTADVRTCKMVISHAKSKRKKLNT